MQYMHEGIKFYEFIKGAMQEGGFNLGKWFSNSKEFDDLIAAKEKAKPFLNEEDSYAKFVLNQNVVVNCVKVFGLL